MAKILLVYTINGSGVIAKIAGTESIAKTKSAISTRIKLKSKGVAKIAIFPVEGSCWRTVNAWPCNVSVTRMRDFKNRSTGLLAISGWWSTMMSILIPVANNMTANKYITQANSITSAAPRPIMIARSTITPNMPQKSTRCWYSRGTAKYVNIKEMIKTLSIANVFSTR